MLFDTSSGLVFVSKEHCSGLPDLTHLWQGRFRSQDIYIRVSFVSINTGGSTLRTYLFVPAFPTTQSKTPRAFPILAGSAIGARSSSGLLGIAAGGETGAG